MTTLQGVVPMLVTPFDRDGALDDASLGRLVDHQLEAGADGLAVLGLGGEGTYLSVEERERVTVVVAEAASGTPLLVGCTAETTEDAARLAAHAAAHGAAAVMVAPPRRPDWSADQVLAHYAAVARAASDCELMVQDAPGFIGVELGVELVLRLARELDNVGAYKVEALPFWENAVRAREAAGYRLRIFGGHGGLYLMDVLDAGSAGLIPGTDSTGPLVRAWRAYAAGDRAGAAAIYAELLPLLVYRAQSLGLLVGGAKALLQARGVIATTVTRLPGGRLQATTLERLFSLADSTGIL